ncbi:hypothetical protein [uncultured Amnibacterium sp.]|uniref:hypothetical protein n=1 Tax=uncultured Amnibacterium sp. TaxID=1631851 RepID=UPI0035CB46B3
MSEVAARPRRGRWSDLVITAVIGVVVVSAALLPAITASSGETLTVQGDVTVGGQPLPFSSVGFWSTTDGVVATSTTDASGRFSLDVPATIDGFAYAGSAPDSTRVITVVDGRPVVRGVIGAAAQPGPASPLYQGKPTATGRGLAGGASEVHFRLSLAGRIAGTSPVPASALQAVQIRRADNSVVQTLELDGSSRFRSEALAPGQYGVVLVPRSPDLPSVADAIVTGGATTTVRPVLPVPGATVTGTVRTPGRTEAGVPVLLEQGGDVVADTTSSSTGDWAFAGVAAGDYTVEVGRYDEPAATSATGADVQIPGASPSPTPSATTASPGPSPTAASPQTAAIQPVERTADGVVPKRFAVTVPTVLGTVGVATEMEAAGRITGVVTRRGAITGTEGAPIRVVVEEAATGRIVRAATPGSDGRYRVGGLTPGERYRVYAVTRPDDLTLAEMGTATARAETTAATADVVIDEAALTLNGTVAGATSGRVAAGDEQLFQGTGAIDESGAYAVQGLVPGAYPVVVSTEGREDAEPVGAVVSGAAPVADLQPGPQSAGFKGWFISSGAGIPVVTGEAVDADGDRVRFSPDKATGVVGEMTVPGLRPGTYEYDPDSFRGTVPALDGPWYFVPPAGTFTLSSGPPTDVGPIVLRTKTH